MLLSKQNIKITKDLLTHLMERYYHVPIFFILDQGSLISRLLPC